MRKLLFIISLFTIKGSLAQEPKELVVPELKMFSLGIHASHVLNPRSDQQYLIKAYGITEEVDKSATQLYLFNIGFSYKQFFARTSFGTSIDFINIATTSSASSGSFSPDGQYFYSSSERSTTIIKERNTAFNWGAEAGCLAPVIGRLSVGGSLGVNYTNLSSTDVNINLISGSYSSSYNNPNGSGSSSGNFSFDNESFEWKSRVTKRNTALLAPRISLLLSLKLTDQFFIEFQASHQLTYELNDGQLSQMKMQFPIGLGLRYHLF